MKPRHTYHEGVLVRHCRCYGILDYIYAYFWKCRECGRWWEV